MVFSGAHTPSIGLRRASPAVSKAARAPCPTGEGLLSTGFPSLCLLVAVVSLYSVVPPLARHARRTLSA